MVDSVKFQLLPHPHPPAVGVLYRFVSFSLAVGAAVQMLKLVLQAHHPTVEVAKLILMSVAWRERFWVNDTGMQCVKVLCSLDTVFVCLRVDHASSNSSFLTGRKVSSEG